MNQLPAFVTFSSLLLGCPIKLYSSLIKPITCAFKVLSYFKNNHELARKNNYYYALVSKILDAIVLLNVNMISLLTRHEQM